jgi:tRNA(Arg) A34 adenosine deaminase TadA
MHEKYMRLAITIASRNQAAPFGVILVNRQSGEVVAEGLNRWQENPTWHGEIDAINRGAARKPPVPWSDVCLYTTAEPCCMCQGAILWTGIPEVVYGTSIRTLQRLGWNQIDIRADEVARRTSFQSCKTIGGILESDCDALFEAAMRRARMSDLVVVKRRNK